MNAELIGALEQLEAERGIAKGIVLEAIEAALVSAYKRNFSSAQNVRVHLDRQTGDIHVYALKNVVQETVDPQLEVSLAEARAKNPVLNVGDVLEIEVKHRDFGRIAAQTAKQVVVQRIREAERGIIYEEFSSREGDIVTGLILRPDRFTKGVIVDLGRVEGLITPQEMIPGERLLENQRVKAYVYEVKRTTKGPQVTLSRTHPGLLKRLLELEVPEIHDGIVEIKAISREAGSRSKVAVHSRQTGVDAVGACVGPKGLRHQNIVNELQGEKVDIVEWSADPGVFVAKSLSPAKVTSVDVDEAGRIARVVVPDNQLSLAIGKEGQNARLAAKLTGWKIDIKSESQVEGGAWVKSTPT